MHQNRTASVFRRRHLGIIIDGGPKAIVFIVDGRIDDGGTVRQFGFGRYNAHLLGADGAEQAEVGGANGIKTLYFALYARALMVGELIGTDR